VASNRSFAVWGKRDLKTAKRLRRKIKRLGIRYDMVATDDWDSFLSAFEEDRHVVGKEHREEYKRKQLPVEASGKGGISKDVLFFEETV
jgi:IS1 family transposase